MCELCDPELADKARRTLKEKAKRLRELARDLDQLASGEVKPHMEYAKIITIRASASIRDLVEEFL